MSSSNGPPAGGILPLPKSKRIQNAAEEDNAKAALWYPAVAARTRSVVGYVATTQWPSYARTPCRSQAGPSVYKPASPPPDVPPKDIPPRTATALSGATTIVRNPSERSRSSIAKRPFEDLPATVPETEPAIRSIFPQYDHTLAFDQQNYYPTQASPTHIPRTVISRQSHVPQQIEPRSPPIRSPLRSPMSAGSTQRWPGRPHEPPVIPPVSTTEELRDYWKAANGWKASSAEGRTFCMKLFPEKDTPVYTLTSRTLQPFYHMRIDPTSASAYVTLSRHDPSKPCKDKDPVEASRNSTGLLSALREAEGKQPWQEALATALEEPSPRRRR
ncbi:hypothetical protein NUW58_g10699 [Xylaria curta]|uniref:Uncharacterized protein n=1 Tax=Xylaria curta TaxID=42375 RepID=A0ACC1MHL4_9PEZI|nr:hypothetical protein NUW58_g10699 [Xylaria curta]